MLHGQSANALKSICVVELYSCLLESHVPGCFPSTIHGFTKCWRLRDILEGGRGGGVTGDVLSLGGKWGAVRSAGDMEGFGN